MLFRSHAVSYDLVSDYDIFEGEYLPSFVHTTVSVDKDILKRTRGVLQDDGSRSTDIAPGAYVSPAEIYSKAGTYFTITVRASSVFALFLYGTVNAVVDWGDTTQSTVDVGDGIRVAHLFTPGTYAVSVSADTITNLVVDSSNLNGDIELAGLSNKMVKASSMFEGCTLALSMAAS